MCMTYLGKSTVTDTFLYQRKSLFGQEVGGNSKNVNNEVKCKSKLYIYIYIHVLFIPSICRHVLNPFMHRGHAYGVNIKLFKENIQCYSSLNPSRL